MRFTNVNAIAFGALVDQRLDLSQGLNVILGPNESGKSTWLAALFAGLCGRKRGRGRGSKADIAFQEQYQPWSTNEWSVRCTVVLDDGRTIELSHELRDRVDCHAIDATTGRDLSGEILFDGSPDGSRMLGLNRDIVRSVIFVEQGELLAVLEDATNLQTHLQRAADNAEGDATARSAIESLEQFLKERLGTQRSPTKPLMLTRKRISERELQLGKARIEVAKYFDLVEELDQAIDLTRITGNDLTDLNLRRDARELRELNERLSRLRPLAKEFADGPPPRPGDREDLLRRAQRTLDAWANGPVEEEPENEPTITELEQQIAALPQMPTGDLEPDEAVEKAHLQVVHIRAELRNFALPELAPEEAPLLETTSPSELRDLASEVERGDRPSTMPEPVHSRLWQAIQVAGTAAAVAGLGLWAFGAAAIGIVLAVVGSTVALIGFTRSGGRKRSAPASTGVMAGWALARVDQLGVPRDPVEIRRLAVQLERIQGERANLERTARVRSETEHRLHEGEQELRGVLAAKGIREEDLGSAYAAYIDQCRARRGEAIEATRREGIERQLKARRELGLRVTRARSLLKEAERGLLEVASEVGTEANQPIDGIADDVAAWLKREQFAHDERIDRWARYQKMESLLRGQTLAHLEDERRSLAEGIGDLNVDAEDLEPEGAELEGQISSVEARLGAENERKHFLQGEVRTLEERLPDIVGLEEAQAHDRASLGRIEESVEVLRSSIAFLTTAEEAVHRTIAPRLQAAIQSRLPAITGNRYGDVTIDPIDLLVKVRTPDGAWHPATLLSHGTKEQVYLLLRVALAEHLATTGETAPLVLDDVTVHMDTPRTKAVLELLHELSAERQIILFSQESDVAEWSKDRLSSPKDRVLTLADEDS